MAMDKEYAQSLATIFIIATALVSTGIGLKLGLWAGLTTAGTLTLILLVFDLSGRDR